MQRDALAILVIGVILGLLLVAVAELIDQTPGGMHPAWMPTPSPTPAWTLAPRTPGTATQGAP